MKWDLDLGDAIRNSNGMRYEVVERRLHCQRRYLLEASTNSRFWVTQDTVDRALDAGVWTLVFRSRRPTTDPTLTQPQQPAYPPHDWKLYLQSLRVSDRLTELEKHVEHLEDALAIRQAHARDDGTRVPLSDAEALMAQLEAAQAKDRASRKALEDVVCWARRWQDFEGKPGVSRYRLRKALEHLDSIQPGIGVDTEGGSDG